MSPLFSYLLKSAQKNGIIGMKAKLTTFAISTIETIVNHGNKAVVQRKGQDVVVMEEKRKILYAGNMNRCEGDKGVSSE